MWARPWLIVLALSWWRPAAVASAAGNRRELTLENGLHVVLIRDDRRPRVAVAVSYKAGARDEPERYRGLAQVAMSVMSHGSRHIAERQITRILERAGATSFKEVTGLENAEFWEEMPTRNYEVALWVESERMAFALDSLTSTAVDAAIVALKEGFQHNEGLHWMRNFEMETLFPKPHPYHRAESRDGLAWIHLPEVQWFVQTYYRPNTATLVLVGDFQIDDAVRLVHQYFDPLVSSGPEVPRRGAPLGDLTGVHEFRSQRRGSAIVLTWSFPGAGLRESKALRILGECVMARRLFPGDVAEGIPAAPPLVSYRWRKVEDGVLFTLEAVFFAKKHRTAELRTLEGYLDSLRSDPGSSCDFPRLREQARRRYLLTEGDFAIAARDVSVGGTTPEEDVAQLDSLTTADLESAARKLATTHHYVLDLW